MNRNVELARQVANLQETIKNGEQPGRAESVSVDPVSTSAMELVRSFQTSLESIQREMALSASRDADRVRQLQQRLEREAQNHAFTVSQIQREKQAESVMVTQLLARMIQQNDSLPSATMRYQH